MHIAVVCLYKLSIVYLLLLGEVYFEALYREDNSITHTAIPLAIIHAGLYPHELTYICIALGSL